MAARVAALVGAKPLCSRAVTEAELTPPTDDANGSIALIRNSAPGSFEAMVTVLKPVT